MLRYPTEATGYSQAYTRRSYPKTRTDCLPPAYALLMREMVPGMKERHGQDQGIVEAAEVREKDYLI
jgi:hypothetical protein